MPDYILEPLDTDPEVIFERFVEFVQTYYPEWNPSEGQLDVIIARFVAMQIAFTADMATRVQRAIYRYFGASLANIPPIPGSPAIATIRFYCQESDRTDILAYGSFVGLRDTNGDQHLFMTLADMVVEPGGTTGTTEAQATELGTMANDLTGTVELVEMVDWIDSAEVEGVSSGGTDPEEDEVYINRLTTNLALMAPRPIIAQDFALISQNIPGVWRAAALDNFEPGDNKIQTITSDRTSGTFKLQFVFGSTGVATANSLNFNATAAQIKTELGTLSLIDERDLEVTGGPLGTAPVVVEFIGQYAMMNEPALNFTSSTLAGGTAHTITDTQAGTSWAATAANSVAVSALDQSGNRLSETVRDELIAYLESLRQQNFLVHYVDPTYNRLQMIYTGVSRPTAVAATVESSVSDSLLRAFDPALQGLPEGASQSSREWYVTPDLTKRKLRYLDITTVVENTAGYDYTESLTFNINGGTMNASDKNLVGTFPLILIPDSTYIDGTVTQG